MEQMNVIKEIYSVGSNNDVNFVIILDGLAGDKFSELMEKPTIFHAGAKSDFLTDKYVYILDKKDASLTGKDHLKTLLKIVMEKYEADHYGFFYKGHGGQGETDLGKGIFDTKIGYIDPAWSEEEIEKKFAHEQPGWTYDGYCEYPSVQLNRENKKPVLLVFSRNNTRSLSYAELADVLKEIFKGKLDFCCLDCCWAQQIENAHNFTDVTDYFIASADEMPVLGVGYAQLCNHFVNRAAINAEEAANLLVAINYNKNYADYDSDIIEFRQMGVSITSTCLKEYPGFFEPFSKLCKKLTDNLEKKDDYTYIIFDKARKNCDDYTYLDTDNMPNEKIDYPMFNIDLVWFMENLLYYNVNDELETMIYEVIFQLKNKLITGFLGSNYKKPVMGTRALGGKGVSICFPINKKQSTLSIMTSRAMKFYKESGWKELLNIYYKYHPEGTYLKKQEYLIAKKIIPDTKKEYEKTKEKDKRLIFRPTVKKDVLKVKEEMRESIPA